jgi:hypothetical protein
VKEFGTISQLESRCSLEVARVMRVLVMIVSLLSVLDFEDEGYVVTFEDG